MRKLTININPKARGDNKKTVAYPSRRHRTFGRRRGDPLITFYDLAQVNHQDLDDEPIWEDHPILKTPTADLTNSPAGVVNLSGTSAGAATVSGALSVTKRLAGSVAGTSTAIADLTNATPDEFQEPFYLTLSIGDNKMRIATGRNEMHMGRGVNYIRNMEED